MCKQVSLFGAVPISRCVTHSLMLVTPGCGCLQAWSWSATVALVQLLFISEGEALFSLPSNEVSLYDCETHHNQSYSSGVNRTETNAAVTRHRTLPVYGLIIHHRLH